MTTSRPFCFVDQYLGRWYLKVGDVTVAMEGDICRDCAIWDSTWTEQGLKEACAKINRARRKTAKRVRS